MADVVISRPASNERQTIQSQPDARYIFNFQAQDATITRDGNTLLLNFDDGSGVVIENFYETHTQESMPTFLIDGQEVEGRAFFEALNEPDLIPAAGPAAGTATQTAQRGGRYNDYGNSDLSGGLDHLTRLDYRSDRIFEHEDSTWITSPDMDLYGANNPLNSIPVTSNEPLTPTYTPPTYVPPTGTTPPGDAPTIMNPPRDPETSPESSTPPIGETMPPGSHPSGDTPPTEGTPPEGFTPPSGTTPPPDQDQPGAPNFIPATGASHVVVDEGALQPEGSGIHKWHGEGGNYYFNSYIPPEEGGTIVLSGVDASGAQITMTFTVNVDGSFAAEPVIRDASGNVVESGAFMSANGVELFNFTLSGGENGHWVVNYDYALTGNQYHDKTGIASADDYSTDTVSFDNTAVRITVTDASGDSAQSQINVEVHDDAPILKVTETAGEEEGTSFTGKFTATFGADGANDVPFRVDGSEGTRNEDGSWTFKVDGGELTVTKGEGNEYSYAFEPEPGTDVTVRNFGITALDGDMDETSGTITVKNNKPTITPDPKDPDDPDDPDEPKDPNDPNDKDPNDPAVSVDANGMHIKVDEAALAASKGEEGAGHQYHGYTGTASFTVQLNGGEGGIVEIGDGYAINIQKGADGNWSATPQGSNVLSTGKVNFEFGNATSKDPDSGQWTVSFTYTLTGNTEHGELGSSTDDVLFDGTILLKVTDSIGRDTAESKITVEIHDDVPVLKVTETAGEEEGTSFTGKFTATFGADGANDVPFKVDGNEGTRNEDGSWTFKVDGGELTVTKGEGNEYSYAFEPEPGTDVTVRNFGITAIDGDSDEASGTITVKNNKPTITPDPKDPDDPDDPDEPKDPNDPNDKDPNDPAVSVDTNGMHIKVDEAALAASKEEEGAGHQYHGYTGTASFTVQLNGGEGGIVEIGDGYAINIQKGADGSWSATALGNNVLSTGKVNFEFGNATSKDPDSGQWTVSFTYTLTGNTEHGELGSSTDDALFDDTIPLKVTDSIGRDTAESKITVEIHDDVPVLKVTETAGEEEGTSFTGKFTATFGADGANDVPFKVDGSEGTRNEDGSWTFKVNGGELTVTKGEGNEYSYAFEPEPGTDVTVRNFGITAIDGDRDETSGIITVKNNKPTITPDPKDPDDPDAPDEPGDDRVQIVGPADLKILGDEHEFPYASPAAAGDGLEAPAFTAGLWGTGHGQHSYAGHASFTVQLKGGEGGTIRIGNDYEITISKNEAGEWFATPNASNEIDADNFHFVFGNAVLKDADAGTWSIRFDYAMTGRVDHNDDTTVDGDIWAPESPSITIVVTDDTGDSATGKIWVEIHDDGPVINASQDTKNATGTWTIGEGEEAQNVAYVSNLTGKVELAYGADGNHADEYMTINDQDVKFENGAYSYTDDQGTLTIKADEDGQLRYEYTPNAENQHTSFANKTFNVVVKDADGDTSDTTITVFQNAKPEIPGTPDNPDGPDSPSPAQPAEGTVNVLVDEAAWAKAQDGIEAGAGHITDGYKSETPSSFTVKLNGGESGKITIGKGDEAIVIDVIKTADGYEAVSSGGEITTANGVKLSFAEGPVSVDADGTVKVEFNYELQGKAYHDKDKGNDTLLSEDNIQIKVEDSINSEGEEAGADKSGDVAYGWIHVEIHDDVPEVKASQGDGDSGKFEIAHGETSEIIHYVNNLTGTITPNYGADGRHETEQLLIAGKVLSYSEEDKSWTTTDGQGTLRITRGEDGNFAYSYELNDTNKYSSMPKKTFTVQIKDYDGDVAETTITVFQSVKPVIPNTPGGPDPLDKVPADPDTGTVNIEVDEAAWAKAKGMTPGGGNQDHGYTNHASFTAKLNGGENGTITIGDGNVVITVVKGEDGYTAFTKGGEFTTDNGVKLTFTKGPVSVAADGTVTVNFTYELTSNAYHDNDKGNGDSLSEDNIPIKIEDNVDSEGNLHENNAGGDVSYGWIHVEIHDDAPYIKGEGNGEVTAGGKAYGNISHSFGADLPAEQTITISINGTDYTYNPGGGEELVIYGTYGVLTVKDDGSYTYDACRHDGDGGDKFQLSIMDSDKDFDTAELEFTVTDRTPITVTVKTQIDDTIEGDHPNGPDKSYVLGSTVLKGEPDGGQPSHDIVIADIASEGVQKSCYYNLAFILDLSSSMVNAGLLDPAKDQLGSVIKQIQGAVDKAAGEVKVLLVGFHAVVTDFVEVTLTPGDKAYDKLLTTITNMKTSTSGNWDHTWDVAGAKNWHNPFITTNYEVALSYTRDWFKEVSVNEYENKAYFITDGAPTLHVTDQVLTTIEAHSTSAWTTSFDVANSNFSEYKLGGNFTAIDKNGNKLYVSETGVVYYDEGHTKPVAQQNSMGVSNTKNFPAPVVMMKDADGDYKPYVTAGSMYYGGGNTSYDQNEDVEARNAFQSLMSLKDEISKGLTVTAIGIGGEIPKLDQYDSTGQSSNNINVSDIASQILDSIHIPDPGSDVVNGGEGRDVLIGDRITNDSDANAEQANVNALKSIVGVGDDQNAQDFLAALLTQHEKVATELDTRDQKGTMGGQDTLVGGKDSDILYGMGGNDVLIGDESAEVMGIIGENGGSLRTAIRKDQYRPNSLDGDEDTSYRDIEELAEELEKNETDDGRAGNDILYGGQGSDVLIGGAGNDLLKGGAGADYLLGGSGNDVIIADTEDRYVDGGSGDDVIFTGDKHSYEKVCELYEVNPDAASIGKLVAAIQSDPEKLANVLKASGNSWSNVKGGAGNDVIFGQENGEALMGDAFIKAALNELLDGDNSSIGVALKNLQNMTYDRLTELDGKLAGFENKNESPASDGDDKIFGFGGKDMVYGGGGDDVLDGGSGEDMLFGGSGNDKLLGGKDNDFLFGGSGNDFLDGGKGEDVIFGGLGDDIIIFDQNDKIIDGGDGFDILLVGKDDNVTLGEILRNDGQGKVSNIEMVLKNHKVDNPAESSIASLASLTAIGITIADERVKIEENLWMRDNEESNETTTVYKYKPNESGLELTLEVSNQSLDTTEADVSDESEIDTLAVNILGAKSAMVSVASLLDSAGEDAIHGKFLSVNENMDTLFRANNNDILVINKSDIFIDGGMNIDIVITADVDLSLKEMLELGKKGELDTETAMPSMRDVDVLIKGEGIDTIADVDELADKFGVKLKEDGKGIELSKDWTLESVPGNENEFQVTTYKHNDANLTLETTLVKAPEKSLLAELGEDEAIVGDNANAVVDATEDSRDNAGADEDSLTQSEEETELAATDEPEDETSQGETETSEANDEDVELAGQTEPIEADDVETGLASADKSEDSASDELTVMADADNAVNEELADTEQSGITSQDEEVNNELASVDQPEADAALNKLGKVANIVADQDAPEAELDASTGEDSTITLVTREEYDRLAAEQDKEAMPEIQKVTIEAGNAEPVDIPDVTITDTPDVASDTASAILVCSECGSAV